MTEQLIDLIDQHLCTVRHGVKGLDLEEVTNSGSVDCYMAGLAGRLLEQEESEVEEEMCRISESYEDIDPVVELFEQSNVDYDRFETAINFLVNVYVPSQCIPVCGTLRAVRCLVVRSILLFHQLSEQAGEFEVLMKDIAEVGKCEKKDKEKDRSTDSQQGSEE